LAFSWSEIPETVLVETICEAPALETKTAAVKTGRTSRNRNGRTPYPSSEANPHRRKIPRPGSLTQLLGEESEGIQTPGQIKICREEEHRIPRAGEIARQHGELVDPGRQPRAALLGEKVDREGPHRAVVDPELAVRVAAGCEEEQGSAPPLVELPLGNLQFAPGDVRGDREGVAELPSLDSFEERGKGIVRHPRPRSPRACFTIACTGRITRNPMSAPPITSLGVCAEVMTSAGATSAAQTQITGDAPRQTSVTV